MGKKKESDQYFIFLCNFELFSFLLVFFFFFFGSDFVVQNSEVLGICLESVFSLVTEMKGSIVYVRL